MLFLVCAHAAEARLLIEKFSLEKCQNKTVFPVYTNSKKAITLTISGSGKMSTAAACMQTATLIAATNHDAWINVGIAGHATRQIGEVVSVNKIIDAGSQQCWYPQFPFQFKCESDACLTVDKPLTDYVDNLCDMEASGFVSTLVRITSLEMIHSIKVVSDNASQPHTNFDRSKTDELIRQCLPVLEVLSSLLEANSHELKSANSYMQLLPVFTRHCHFTTTQTHQLEGLLRRWQCLRPGVDPFDQYQSADSAKKIIRLMQIELDSIGINFADQES